MSSLPSHPVQTGTIGGTPIIPNLLDKGAGAHPWDLKKVQLSANYARVHPAGMPHMPPAGVEVKSRIASTGTITSGTIVPLFAHEAAAIVAAGGGSYV
jgi:hypothetical protein